MPKQDEKVQKALELLCALKTVYTVFTHCQNILTAKVVIEANNALREVWPKVKIKIDQCYALSYEDFEANHLLAVVEYAMRHQSAEVFLNAAQVRFEKKTVSLSEISEILKELATLSFVEEQKTQFYLVLVTIYQRLHCINTRCRTEPAKTESARLLQELEQIFVAHNLKFILDTFHAQESLQAIGGTDDRK